MLPRIKIAIGVLAIAALSSVAVLGVGCGGGGEDGAERAVKWTVERQLGARQARLLATVKACIGRPPRLEPPVIEYSGRRVFIELLVAPVDEPEANSCFLQLFTAGKTITLKRNLDELVLFDASTDPPERRWPR